MKTLAERFNFIKSQNSRFIELFGVGLQRFHHPILGFDVVEFDEYLIEKYGDYMDGQTSMDKFIEKQFGQEASVLISRLIKGE